MNKLLVIIGGLMVASMFYFGYSITHYQGSTSYGNYQGQSATFYSVGTSTLETVGTSNTSILATSTGRTWATISNNSGSPILCRFANGAPASSNTGFVITASTTYTMNQLSEPVYTGAINCISEGTAAAVYVEANQQ